MAIGDLDEFRLVRPLGRGGMGEVYLGHDTVLDRPVAIKLIGSRTPDLASRERFLREARAIARLSHPNVVAIFRAGTTADGRPFLVQELIRGQSLDRVARPVAAPQLCEIAIGIARGLEAAHRRGILHRDVKPANVMLDEHGTARLLDFGLAKLTGGEPSGLVPGERDRVAPAAPPDRPRATDLDATRDSPGEVRASRSDRSAADVRATGAPDDIGRTAPGAVIGTPRYMAPEIWRGEPATARSDLYSLGAVLYELATGIPPYAELEVAALERAVLAGTPRPVAELAPELPPALARLVMRCLARDPGARPASAGEVAHELEAIVVDAPAIPQGDPYRGLRAFRAEHRGLFFGRGADVSSLVDRFRTEALLVVAGDSGIGKSSVCHAGVVPAVVAGALADPRRWRAVAVVPGRRPWDALRDALALGADHAHAAAADLVRALRPQDGQGLLIVVDQLEELVTVSDRAQAARLAELLGAVADGTPGVKALVAVRGDFLTRVAALPDLDRAMTRGLHLLRVLARGDLREAIVGPARAMGVAFESERMVDRLIDTVAGDPGALPLLAFALAELWQARDAASGLITQAALDALGGVEGALARHADAVLRELPAPERAAARSMLLRLVTPAQTRALRGHDELVARTGASTAVLESLIRGRLVVARDTLDGAATYELAHEALITSWGTLRDWLDAAAGQHAVRSRLLASAAEWHRLDRRGDLLWSARQLEEARELADLTAQEQAFVTASVRRARRRRWGRIAAVLAVPVIAIAIWAGIRIAAARAREREVAARVATASRHRGAADALAREAGRTRQLAFASFDLQEDEAGEQQWSRARGLGAEAHAGYRDAEAELEAARAVDSDAVREEMARVLTAHATLARAEHDRARFDELARRLDAYAPAGHRPWATPGRLVVDSPRARRIAVHRLRAAPGPTIAGGFAAEPISIGPGGHLELDLAPGSYLVMIATADGLDVRDPVWIEPGAELRRLVEPPAARAVPPGFVYVAPGPFLYGSDRDDDLRRGFLYAQPLHPVATGAYLIARTEVTFADWIDYLRALPAGERAIRRPHDATVDLGEVDGRYVLTLQPTTVAYRSAGPVLTYPGREANATVHWERLPVSGVSWDDALAYFAWLDRTGRVPHARPCTPREWERAARGADGREFPTGGTLPPGAANIDATYDRQPLAFGPDEVGSHPASDSPFGISDMAGNSWDLIRGPGGKPWMKGGSWYYGALTANASNRGIGEPTQRNIRLGYRVCADAAPAR